MSRGAVFLNISSFSRMRSYRKDGRTAVLLKLVLPCVSDDTKEYFNVFYTSLAESYSSLADGISKRVDSTGVPVVVSVGFEVLIDIPKEHKYEKRKESLLIIKRTHRIRKGNKIKSGAFIDFFDTVQNIFLK